MKYINDYKKFENTITIGGSVIGRLFYIMNRKVNNILADAKIKFINVFDSDDDLKNDDLSEMEANELFINKLLNRIKKMSDDNDDIEQIIKECNYVMGEVNKIKKLPNKKSIIDKLDTFITELVKIRDEENEKIRKYVAPSSNEPIDSTQINDVRNIDKEEEKFKKYISKSGGSSYKEVDDEESRKKRLDDYNRTMNSLKNKESNLVKKINRKPTETNKKITKPKPPVNKRLLNKNTPKSKTSVKTATKKTISKKKITSKNINTKPISKSERKKKRKKIVKDFYDFIKDKKTK